jgi:hypothetical protein
MMPENLSPAVSEAFRKSHLIHHSSKEE